MREFGRRSLYQERIIQLRTFGYWRELGDVLKVRHVPLRMILRFIWFAQNCCYGCWRELADVLKGDKNYCPSSFVLSIMQSIRLG